MSETREPGFYWVYLDRWEIAEWCNADNGSWQILGDSRLRRENYFAKIGEQIVRIKHESS